MASRSFFEEDLSCPVCLDIFRNPVVLSCSHSFCEHCIRTFWRKKSSKTCPVCRKESSHKHPQLNLALRNLCEIYQQERIQKSPSGVCSDHNEKLKLFCLDDQQLVCLVCRDSRKHSNHRFCPVDEVALDNKKELGYSLGHLQKKLRIFMNFKQTLDQTAQQIKIQTQDTEIQINGEFKKLQQFLCKEEAARMKALGEEEKQKSQKIKQKMEETTKQISSLTNTIRDIEKQMNAEDVSFLQNFKSTLQRAQITLPDPQNITETISVPKHLSSLKLAVLQKMQDNMKTSDVSAHSYGSPVPPRNFNQEGAPTPILHNFNRAGAAPPSPSPLPPKPILHSFNRAGAAPPSPSPLPPKPKPILHSFYRAGAAPPSPSPLPPKPILHNFNRAGAAPPSPSPLPPKPILHSFNRAGAAPPSPSPLPPKPKPILHSFYRAGAAPPSPSPLPPKPILHNFNRAGAAPPSPSPLPPKPILHNFNRAGAAPPSPSPLPPKPKPKPILHSFNRAGAAPPSPSPLPPKPKPILHNFNRAGAAPPSPSPHPPKPTAILHNFNRAEAPPPSTQNCELQFPVVKSLVKKINEQMRM